MIEYDVIVINRKTNRKVIFTAESFRYLDHGGLSIFHSELGNAHHDLDDVWEVAT